MPSPIRLFIEVDSAPGNARTISQLADQMASAMNGKTGGDAGGAAFTQLGVNVNAANAQVSIFNEKLTKSRSLITDFAAAIYSLERVGSFLKSVLIDPFDNFGRAIVNATEDSRKFEYAISGVAGGLSRARQLNQQLVQESRTSPLSVADLRQGAQSLAATPGLSNQISFGSPADAAKQADSFSRLVARLGDLNPTLDSGTVTASLRAGLAGDTNQLRRRFGIQDSTLADLVGAKPEDLKTNPALVFQGVNKWADIFIPESSLDLTSNLITTRIGKLKDAFNFALTKIGDSGAFDKEGDRLKNFGDQLFTYFTSGAFDQQATRISTDIDQVVGNVGTALEKLLNAITGKPADVSTVAGTVDAVGNVLDRLAKLSDSLPGVVDKIGPSITSLTSKLGAFADAIIHMNEVASHPGNYLANMAAGAVTDPFGRDYLAKKTGDRLGDITQMFIDHANGVDTPGGAPPLATSSSNGSNLLASRGDEPQIYSLFRRLVKQEYQAPNFAAQLSQAMGGNVDLDQITNRSESPLSKLTSAGGKVFGNIAVGPNDVRTFGDFLTSVKAMFDSNKLLLNAAIDAGHAEFAGNVGAMVGGNPLTKFGNTGQLMGNMRQSAAGLNVLETQRDLLTNRFTTTMNSIIAGKLDSVKDYAEALGSAIKNFPPEARAELEKKIMEGTTDLGNQFVKIFGEPVGGRSKSFGLESLPIGRQAQTLEQYLATQQDQIGNAGKYGDVLSLSPKAGVGGVMGLKPLTPDEVLRRQLSFDQGEGTDDFRGLLDRATKAYSDNPTDENLANVREAQTDFAKLNEQILTLGHTLDDVGQQWDKFADEARNSIESHLGDAIDNLITKTGSLKDVFRSLAQDIVKDFSNMEAHNLVEGLVGHLGQANQGSGGQGPGGLGGLLGGLFHGFSAGANPYAPLPGDAPVQQFANGAGSLVNWNQPPPTAPASGGLLGGLSQGGAALLGGIFSMFGLEDGGVLPGHFMPVRAFANGGIVDRPMLGMVGEGRMNEAIVPLPNGSHIPVVMHGGDKTPDIKVAVYSDFDAALASRSHYIVETVTGHVTKTGTKLNKAVRGVSGD